MPFYTEEEYNLIKDDLDEIIYTLQMYFDEEHLDSYWSSPGEVSRMVNEAIIKLKEGL